MLKKSFSKAGEIAMCIFLVMLMMFFSAQYAQAQTSGTATGWICCRFWVSFSGGLTFPSGVDNITKKFNKNILINIKIWCWANYAIVLEGGYNAFKWDLEDIPGVDLKWHWWNFNPTFRYFFGKDKFKPFLSVGPGIYFPKAGDAQVGGKLGLGFDYKLSDRVMFEMGADYHHILLEEKTFEWEKHFGFLHIHAGFEFRIK